MINPRHSQPRGSRSHGFGRLAAFAATTLVVLLSAAPVAAQSARTLYARAQTRETAARKQAAPTLTSLRAIATSYENIVRRYPANTYADNALWQGALVLELAYQRGGQVRDVTNATRLLRWLQTEYPHSTFVKPTAAKLAALTAKAAPAPTTARSTPVPPPTTPIAAAATAPPAAATAPVAATSRPAATPAAPAPASAASGPPPVASIALTSVTLSPLPKGDRLTLELSRESAYALEADSNGRQLTLALTDVGLGRDVLTSVVRLRGAFVQAARSTSRAGATDLVFTLNGRARYSAFPLYEPYRLVIDIESDGTTRPVAAVRSPAPVAMKTTSLPPVPTTVVSTARDMVPAAVEPETTPSEARVAPPVVPTPQTPASTRSGGFSLARQLGLGVSRVVIDPGHGGHDPGARANGLNEADAVLDVALRLEALLLAQPGFEVVLTRRTNVFIPLEERTAIANRESADLFLSIHANSSPRSTTRGIETYFLNLASNPQAEAVAARENAASEQSMRTLPSLVRAITNNNKLAESREFANIVQTALFKQLQTQSKDIKDLGVKQAPFVVLIGAAMPSVLAEIAFITNRADATQLKAPAGRQKTAQALADAILRYQSSLKKVTSVAAVAQTPTAKGQD